MKILNKALIFLMMTFLISCGGKKDDKTKEQRNLEELQRRLRQQQLQSEQNNKQTKNKRKINEQGPVTEKLNELYFSVRSSGIDMKPLEEGQKLFIQCQGFEQLQEIDYCFVGYDQRDLDFRYFNMSRGHSEDIANSIESEALYNSLINHEVLSINCKDGCEISHTL